MTNMTTPNLFRVRSSVGRTALIALGCALGLALVQVAAAGAGDVSVLRPLDDQLPALPLTAAFDKGTDPDVGPYILSLKNTSKDAIKVNVKIQQGQDRSRSHYRCRPSLDGQ